jgi:hypothetical protein
LNAVGAKFKKNNDMAKTIIEWNGKRYQVVRGLDQRDDICLGCAFEGTTECVTDEGLLCNEFDSKYYHIFKLIDNGTK